MLNFEDNFVGKSEGMAWDQSFEVELEFRGPRVSRGPEGASVWLLAGGVEFLGFTHQ